jgi:hypothetical protein
MKDAFGMKHISDAQLTAKIRRLGTTGYMAKSDFGWLPDELVSAAYKDLKVVGNACKS